MAEVIPIYKSGPKCLCSNYRPISILSPLSKIFEKCIYDQLYHYFDSHKLFSPDQYGFKKNSSTSDAVLDIYNCLLENLDNKLTTCSVFLDLAKAFDTINHTILLRKLEKYGVRGLPLSLIKNYLTNRKQYTLVSGTKSHSKKVLCGVPQGSTLGPLLFIIYINDLPQATKFQVRLFADDTNLTLSHSQPQSLQANVNEELRKINCWMNINKLSINYNKTEYIVVTRKKNKPKLELLIGNNLIEQNNCIKYLGVKIDDNLNWKPQIQQQCKKIARGSWAIQHLQKYVDLHTLHLIYFSMVYPHLQYCISSWGSASNTSLHPLKLLQKRCVRRISNREYRAHTQMLFKKLEYLKLHDIYLLETAKTMYKICNGMSPINYSQKMIKLEKIHLHNTRQNQNNSIFVKGVRTKFAQKSTLFFGAQLWNKLPNDLKKLPYHRFKKALKCKLIDEY